jgi:hypothetical protein
LQEKERIHNDQVREYGWISNGQFVEDDDYLDKFASLFDFSYHPCRACGWRTVTDSMTCPGCGANPSKGIPPFIDMRAEKMRTVKQPYIEDVREFAEPMPPSLSASDLGQRWAQFDQQYPALPWEPVPVGPGVSIPAQHTHVERVSSTGQITCMQCGEDMGRVGAEGAEGLPTAPGRPYPQARVRGGSEGLEPMRAYSQPELRGLLPMQELRHALGLPLTDNRPSPSNSRLRVGRLLAQFLGPILRREPSPGFLGWRARASGRRTACTPGRQLGASLTMETFPQTF